MVWSGLNLSDIAGRLVFISFVIILVSCRKELSDPQDAGSFIRFYEPQVRIEGTDVKTLANGGYVLTGTSTGRTSDSGIVLLFADRFGNLTGDPVYFGGSFDSRSSSLTVLRDGGLAIFGTATVRDKGASSTKMYLVRTDPEGNEIWSRTYGSSSDETGFSLSETSDGGFILIGTTTGKNGKTDIMIIRTNSEGREMWIRTHGGREDDAGLYITETEEGYIYTGYTRSFSHRGQSNSNIFLVRTNSLGRVTFPYTYGGHGDDYGRMVIPHPVGGVVLLGTTTVGETRNIFLARIGNNLSEPLWINIFEDPFNHRAASMRITPEGEYIITGTRELTDENHVIFLLKADEDGNQIFMKTFGGGGRQQAAALDIASDGGYILVGSNETGSNNMLTLIKTNKDGEL